MKNDHIVTVAEYRSGPSYLFHVCDQIVVSQADTIGDTLGSRGKIICAISHLFAEGSCSAGIWRFFLLPKIMIKTGNLIWNFPGFFVLLFNM